ncbi:MAG: C2 family cysteine protease [Kofleriaceae bacterium]
MRKLADAAGREQSRRRWSRKAVDPLHGERVHGTPNLRTTAHENIHDAEAMRAEYGEEMDQLGLSAEQYAMMLEFANRGNVAEKGTAGARLVVRDFVHNDDGDWSRVENQRGGGKTGFVREDEMQTSRDHELRVQGPLFPRPPRPSDVEQGSLGDCFLMAPLGAIARRNPQLIMDMVVDRTKVASVRFFRRAANGQFIPEWVTVDKTVVERDTGGPKFASVAWVGIIEKAYAQRAGNHLYGCPRS